MTHTPVPWKVVPFVDATIIDSETESGYGTEICRLHGRPEHLDNARLIASAPDLLEACKMAVTEIYWSDHPELCDKINAAIAKATGAS